MIEQKTPPSKQVDTQLDLNNKINKLDATVFAVFKDKSNLYDEYNSASNSLRGE